MKRFLKSLSLLLCSSFFAITGWAETIAVNQEIIGINFTTSGKLMSADSTEEWGYYSQENNQGGLLAENKWQNFTSLAQNASYTIQTTGNSNLSVCLKKTTNNAVWGPGSNNSFYTENKLLGAYLDNGSTLEFSGLPTSGYDVAIIFAGDGGAKLSCVTVNGTDKTYNENGELVDGSDPWGERKTGAADLKQLTATGTSDAERVMYLSDLNTETLTLQTYSNDGGKSGRGTIAAIQIYIKSGTIEKTFAELAELPEPTWVWDGKKADGTSCEVLTTLPVGPAYKVNNRIFDLDALKIPAKNFTYSFWTMRNGPADWRNYGGFSNTSGLVQIQRDDTGSTVHIYPDGATLASGDMAFPLASETYELVTFVQDSGTLKVYVNGVLRDEDTLNGWASLTDDEATMRWFALGEAPNKSGGSFGRSGDARIADARIYSVALSAEQVEALYFATPVTPTYWATFNGDALTSDKVTSEDGFSLQGDAASFITVSGLNKAWNVSGDSWGTQSILAEDSTTFTLSVNAKMGTTTNGLLFAFGNKDNGGLALRRTDADHVVLTTGTSTEPVLTGEAIANDINYYNYTIVAVAGKLMLYINGVPVKDGEGNIVEASATNLITTNNFQPGRRFDGLLNEGAVEKNGSGAIDEMVAWKGVALTSVQVKNTYDLYLKTAISRRALATAEENWSDAEWNDGDDAAPTQGQVMLTSNVDGGSTLTMDASVTVDTLTFTGETSTTIAASNTNKLTSSNTRVATDTTVNAGAANLGAVVIADDKTLTVKDNATVGSVVGGTLAIDATAGDVVFTANTVLTREEIRLYTGKIHVKGAGENGIALEYAGAQASEFGPNLILDGGTHTFYYQRAYGQLFASGDSNDNPTIWVKNNAKLTFRSHDLSGWEGGVDATGVIRVDNGSTLNFTNNGGSTSYYRQRLYLEPGATMTIADAFNKNFRLQGGVATAETAQLYVPEVAADAAVKVATISGAKITFAKDDTNGLGIYVGTNATLAIHSPFDYTEDGDGKASPIAKYGEGTLLLKGGYAPTGNITINAGTLALGFTGALTNAITNNATLAADGENVVMNLTGATLSGSGTYVARNGAILKLTFDQVTSNTVAADGGTVYVVLTESQQESEKTVTVSTSNNGVYQFVDANDNPLSRPNTNYVPSNDRTYDVAEGAWDTEPSDFDSVVIAFGDAAGEVDLSTILGDVTALSKLTITGSNGGTITNVAEVATCTAIVLETATTMPAELAALADTIESTATLSIVGGTETVDVSGVISGAIQVKIVSGKVTFSGANTYTGGTDIAEGATLTISHANALSTSGTITGAGTLVCDSVRPANLNGLTTGVAASEEAPASGWTGTVWLKNVTDNASIWEFANENSSLTFEGAKGHFTSFAVKTLTLMGENFGFQPNNGSSGPETAHNVMTIGALKGSGSLLGPTGDGSNGAFCYAYVIGDMSEFNGTLNTTSHGGRTVVWCGAAEQSVNYHDYDGKIVIAGNVTIAASKAWESVNGIVVQEGAQLTVNGAITGAIANAGTLTYGVDTTATNAISGAGLIVANGEGVELDLCSATLTDFSGFLNATGGATIKLPYAETEGKTLSADGTSKFIVVLNNDETDQNNLHAVMVTGRGTLEFVDEAGHTLPSSGSTYVLPTYTVTDEGGSWNVAPLQYSKVVIDFAETTEAMVDLATILGDVTALTKLTVTGSKGGTITNSTVTACPTVVVTAGGRTVMPAALLNLATTVTPSTVEGASLYVMGETTTRAQTFSYTGNRHFETIKFDGQQNVGAGIENYIVAEGETMEFLFNNGVRYLEGLIVDGGTVRTTHDKHVWLAGKPNAVFTLKEGLVDFSVVTVDSGSDGILIGYNESTHTFDIQGGELNAPNTSIVGYQPDSHYRQSGGTVKTKGFRQHNTNFTEMTLTGGTIELGTGGIPNLGMESISFGGATIHAVADNIIAEALNMTANATLSAAEGKTMTVTSAITGTATLSIAGAGTVDLSGATIANTIALEVAAESTATVVVSVDQLSSFAKVTIPETATLKVKTNYTIDEKLTGGRKEYTLGEGSTITGNVTIDGVTGTGAFSDDKLTVSFDPNPTLTGNAWWWDYEFNGNVTSTGSDTAPLVLEGNGTSYVTVDGDNQALYFQKTPYRANGEDVKARFAEVDTFTAVMYCQPGNHNNVPLVGFGSTTQDDKVAVVLATGAVAADGEMAIMLVKGNNHVVTPLADNLVVPNATKAYHLYAFTFDARENETVISVYVDGKLKKTTTVNEHFRVSNGFQIGSIHGGVMTNQTGLSKYPDSGDSGTIDFLRVTKGLLSADAMRALAEAYKYESENGEATRTIEEATANWVAESTWTQTKPGVEAVQQDAPNNGTNVTLTANVATAVTVDLEEAVTYETVAVVGDAAVTFKKGDAATFKAGDITIGTDVTIEYGAINVGTLIVNGGKTLTFDFKGYDFNSIYASKTLPLTGLATLGENATVTVALPTLPAYLTAECVFDAKKSEYALAITVKGTLTATIENNAITWKVGDTVVTPPADLTAVESITMTVVGNNSVTLPEMTLASVVLTGEGGSVTFESGKLTVTNTLTMNNVNVMATPDTLAAAVVMGTAGTESFTMYSQASYSHENKFAMRFENCAFTKDGVGTFPIASSGFVLDRVNVTLKNGALQLVIGSGDPQIKDTTFTYVDANKDGTADGELTNHGWVHSTTSTTFVVPEGVTGKALVGSCLTDTGAVVKQGAGTLELGVMKTANANPYTGATTIDAGTLVYDVTNNTANTFVMQSAITVKAGAAIKGVEDCTLANLIMEDGAIIDATNGAVTATTVTLPTGEGAKVVLKKNASGDVLTYTGKTPNMKLFTTATTLENKALGLGVKIDNGVVTLVLTQVSVPEVVIPDNATEEERAELVKQQTEAEVAAQEVADALAASTDEETRTANVTAIENPGVASVIENAGVELTQNEGEETYTAKFTYNFGVSTLDVVALNLDDVEGAELYVVVKAELDDDYSFAEGVTVSVTDGDKNVTGSVSVTDMNGTKTTDAPTGNTRYFRFPLPTDLGTHSYRVRASK